MGAVARRLLARGRGSGAVQVAIRPESIRIARNGSGGILEADVVKATYLGSHMEYTLTTPLGDLFAVDSYFYHPAHVAERVPVDLAKRGVPLVRIYRHSFTSFRFFSPLSLFPSLFIFFSSSSFPFPLPFLFLF